MGAKGDPISMLYVRSYNALLLSEKYFYLETDSNYFFKDFLSDMNIRLFFKYQCYGKFCRIIKRYVDKNVGKN